MTAIVIRGHAKATGLTGLTGLASLRTRVSDVGRRAVACAAAAVMVGAVGAVLLQLVAQLLSFPAPVAMIGITLMAAALLNSLRRHLRARAGHRDLKVSMASRRQRPALGPSAAGRFATHRS